MLIRLSLNVLRGSRNQFCLPLNYLRKDKLARNYLRGRGVFSGVRPLILSEAEGSLRQGDPSLTLGMRVLKRFFTTLRIGISLNFRYNKKIIALHYPPCIPRFNKSAMFVFRKARHNPSFFFSKSIFIIY